jgi:hypothetical protein
MGVNALHAGTLSAFIPPRTRKPPIRALPQPDARANGSQHPLWIDTGTSIPSAAGRIIGHGLA